MHHQNSNHSAFDESICDLNLKQMKEILARCRHVDTQILINSSGRESAWFGGLLVLIKNVVSRARHDIDRNQTLQQYATTNPFEEDALDSGLSTRNEGDDRLDVLQSFKSLYAAAIEESIKAHQDAAQKEREYYSNTLLGKFSSLFGYKAQFKESAELVQLLMVDDELKATVDIAVRESAKACLGPDRQYLTNTTADRFNNQKL